MFVWPDDMEDSVVEKRATAIGGAFLITKNDIIRELGIRRNTVSRDMILTAVEYGISVMLLVTRAKICGVVSNSVAKDFYIKASASGWRTNEPTRIEPEKATLFEQLVYRAVSEADISVQKGAELLHTSYDEIASHCSIIGEV